MTRHGLTVRLDSNSSPIAATKIRAYCTIIYKWFRDRTALTKNGGPGSGKLPKLRPRRKHGSLAEVRKGAQICCESSVCSNMPERHWVE